MIRLLANPEFPFVQLPLILGPAIFQINSFKIANHPKNWFNYTGFVQKLDNIRNQDGTYFDKVFMIHIIRCYATILINICPWYIKNK